MEAREALKNSLARIEQMELYFDTLQKTAKMSMETIREDESLKAYFQTLVQYYESGMWLRDYELDEKGMLPANLKRGVLAQDALYDFLEQIDSAEE